MVTQGNSSENLKGGLMPILHRVFQKIQEDGRLPNSFYEANIILLPKPDKDIIKNVNFKQILLINLDVKILNKILINHIQQYVKKIYTMIKWDSSQVCKDGTIFTNQ